MIETLSKNLAQEIGVEISEIALFDGHNVGCLDVYLLQMYSQGYMVNALVHQYEIDHLEAGDTCDKLRFKIRAALARLKSMLDH